MKEPLEGTMSEKEWRGRKEIYEEKEGRHVERKKWKSKEEYIMSPQRMKCAFDEFYLKVIKILFINICCKTSYFIC